MRNLPPGYNELESLDDYLTKLYKQVDQMSGLLLWALYHHQGGSSTIGQPIRKILGIGEHDAMTPEQIKEAKTAGGVLVTHNAKLTSPPRGSQEENPSNNGGSG